MPITQYGIFSPPLRPFLARITVNKCCSATRKAPEVNTTLPPAQGKKTDNYSYHIPTRRVLLHDPPIGALKHVPSECQQLEGGTIVCIVHALHSRESLKWLREKQRKHIHLPQCGYSRVVVNSTKFTAGECLVSGERRQQIPINVGTEVQQTVWVQSSIYKQW